MSGRDVLNVCLLLTTILYVSLCTTTTTKREEELTIDEIKNYDFGNSDELMEEEEEYLYGSTGSCDGDICDPGRYRQIRSALCGYNAFLGEPYSVVDGVMDQGIRHQIFEPGTKDAQGKIVLKGITAIDQKLCTTELSSQVITNAQNFSKKINKISGLGFGIDMEIFKVGIGLTFSHSSTMDEINAFFANDHGAINIAYMQCITAKIFVDYFDLPKFKNGFKRGVQFLAKASKQGEARQKYFFRRFINEYGTHYITGTEMGATVMETRFLTKKARKSYSRETLNTCTKFDAHLKYDDKFNSSAYWHKCKDFRDGANSTADSLIKKQTFVVKGCSPPKDKDISQWASQSFTPMPLKFELSPISNLLSEEVFEDQGMKDIDAAALRKWFIPMLGKYCDIMGIDCKIRGGCGFSDNCKLNEDCMVIDPKKETYKCVVDGKWSEWGPWSECSVKCGKGKQKRSRKCSKPSKGGRPCPGKASQFKDCDKGSCDGQVYEHECKWLTGGDGKSMECPHGTIAVGACGSLALADCEDEKGTEKGFTKLKCCKTSAKLTSRCSLEKSTRSGFKMSCPYQKVVTSYCGSGMYRDCWAGNWAYFDADCCMMEDHVVASDSKCYWNFAASGKDLECSHGMIMTGVCGVGHYTTEKCPKHTEHGIKCCHFYKKANRYRMI